MQFSASANYNPDGDFIESRIYLQDNGVNKIRDILSAQAELIQTVHSKIGDQDVILKTIPFSGSLSQEDGSILLTFNHPLRTDNLKIALLAALTGGGSVNGIFPVLTEPGFPQGATQPFYEKNTSQREIHRSDDYEHDLAHDPTPETLVEEIERPVLVELDFTALDTVVFGEDEIEYTGGGNRLLSTSNGLILQELDEAPWTVEATTFVEQERTNLLPNPTFVLNSSQIPNGYDTYPPNPSVVYRLNNDLGEAAKVWEIHVNAGIESTKTMLVRTPKVPVNISENLTASVVMKLEKDLPDTVISKFYVRLEFFDNADNSLAFFREEYDGRLLSSWQLVSQILEAANIPSNTVTAQLQFELYGVDLADNFTLSLFIPQLEAGKGATSRIVSGTRVEDELVYPNPSYLNAVAGTMELSFVGYEGIPLEEKILFDIRQSGIDGIMGRHTVSGYLELLITEGLSTYIISTDIPWIPEAGFTYKIGMSWDLDAKIRRIFVNDILMKEENVVAFMVPSSTNPNIFIGRGEDSGYMNTQILGFRYLREVLI